MKTQDRSAICRDCCEDEPGCSAFCTKGLEPKKERKPRRKQHFSLNDSSRSARNLGIKTAVEYKERFKEDPLLISDPEIIFAGEWKGWNVFLGTGKSPRKAKNCYQTVEKARTAAKKLGIVSSRDYGRKYKKNPFLPSNPNKTYRKSGWVGWEKFLK